MACGLCPLSSKRTTTTRTTPMCLDERAYPTPFNKAPMSINKKLPTYAKRRATYGGIGKKFLVGIGGCEVRYMYKKDIKIY